jgi:hypothetical protein
MILTNLLSKFCEKLKIGSDQSKLRGGPEKWKTEDFPISQVYFQGKVG